MLHLCQLAIVFPPPGCCCESLVRLGWIWVRLVCRGGQGVLERRGGETGGGGGLSGVRMPVRTECVTYFIVSTSRCASSFNILFIYIHFYFFSFCFSFPGFGLGFAFALALDISAYMFRCIQGLIYFGEYRVCCPTSHLPIAFPPQSPIGSNHLAWLCLMSVRFAGPMSHPRCPIYAITIPSTLPCLISYAVQLMILRGSTSYGIRTSTN